MQHTTGLTHVTVLEWKQNVHSGASTGRKNGKKAARKRVTIYIMLAIYIQGFLLSLFLACGREECFIRAMSWGKPGSSQKDALFPPTVFEEMDLWSALRIQRLFCGTAQEVAGLRAAFLYSWWRYCPEPWTDSTWQGTPMGRVATLHFSSVCGELQS